MRARDWTVLLAASFFLSLLVACSERALEPGPVPLDRVSCARCGMMVSREADSAQWVSTAEDVRFYDDIGCLAAENHRPAGRNARFVRVSGTRWAPAESAFYARPVDASTPMGYGFVGFSTGKEAAEHDREGKTRTWEELVGEVRSGEGAS